MFVYDFDRLNDFLKRILQKHITPETWTWLEDAARAAAAHDMSKFNIAFVAMPRKTGKNLVEISSSALNNRTFLIRSQTCRVMLSNN